jgi:peptide/nickel transport system substrate-binding protein
MADLSKLTRRETVKSAAVAGGVVMGSGLLAACGSSGGSKSTSAGTPASAPQKKGGRLRVGITGGGSADTLDPHTQVSDADLARTIALFDLLTRATPSFALEDRLAAEYSSNADASEWTVRLRKGVEFHDGKTLSADDLIYTIRRILDPKTHATAAGQLTMVDPNKLKKVDDLTVRFTLKQPYAPFREQLTTVNVAIVPVGFDPKHPVGTGPFKVKSFSPGRQSVFTAFENYFGTRPFIDELVIENLDDESARVNALLSGQVDAIAGVPLAQMQVIQSNSGAQLLVSKSGAFRPLEMRADKAPFTDVRVRQAMRLVADRKQMLEGALSGQGAIASDLYCPDDPVYNSSLPQREQDIEQAVSLLRQAGQESLHVELVTSPIQTGVVEACQIFAQNAKAANVTVKVTKLPPDQYYNGQYLQRPFGVDWWGALRYFTQVSLLDGGGAFDGVHWGNAQFKSLTAQATREKDEAKRNELAQQMQKLQYDEGGLIIWAFANIVDAHSKKVTGFVPSKLGYSLSGYDFTFPSFV